MNPTVQAVRAVTAEYAHQLLRPLLVIGVLIYVVIMAVIIWASVAASPWWLLLSIVPTPLFLIAIVLWVILWNVSTRLSPNLNKSQKTATKKFVSRIGRVAEHVGTPRFLLVFHVLKDVLLPPKRDNTFITELVQTPGDMKRDFDELRKLF